MLLLLLGHARVASWHFHLAGKPRWLTPQSCSTAWQVDRHKYVKLAYHGFQALSREDRMRTYNDSGNA